jgi:hypothetical protein
VNLPVELVTSAVQFSIAQLLVQEEDYVVARQLAILAHEAQVQELGRRHMICTNTSIFIEKIAFIATWATSTIQVKQSPFVFRKKEERFDMDAYMHRMEREEEYLASKYSTNTTETVMLRYR